MVPQLILTLSPLDELCVELPGANGARRKVLIHDLSSLKRMLLAQRRGERGIASEAEPTQAEVKHWKEHRKVRDERCPFCRAELAAIAASKTPNILKELGLL